MALQKTVESTFGLEVKDAYIRVENIDIVSKVKFSFSVRSYVDKNLPHFSEIIYFSDYELQGKNPFEQAYLYLKTLPEFAGATDV